MVVWQAALGALLYRPFFTQDDATTTVIDRAKAFEKFGEIARLVATQDMTSAESEVLTENKRTFRYELSKTVRIGELTTGGTCDIGGTLKPQVRR